MHRSGTSAFAGTLAALGFDLGRSLIPADVGINDLGYWENARIVELHERILRGFGLGWWDERGMPDHWREDPRIRGFANELRGILLDEFSGEGAWVVKDPRLCRLLPVWKMLASENGMRLSVVFVLRDPREVAKSLDVRDGICSERASLLWLRYMLDAEAGSVGLDRALVTYDGFLKDWRNSLLGAGRALGMDFCISGERGAAVDEFLRDSLRHHRDLPLPDGKFESLALRVYQGGAASGVSGIERLVSSAGSVVDDGLCVFEAWTAEIGRLRAELYDLKLLHRVAEQKLAAMTAEVERVKNSFSWKISAPLRVVAGFVSARRSAFRGAVGRGRGD